MSKRPCGSLKPIFLFLSFLGLFFWHISENHGISKIILISPEDLRVRKMCYQNQQRDLYALVGLGKAYLAV
jgi:hypothetical protein